MQKEREICVYIQFECAFRRVYFCIADWLKKDDVIPLYLPEIAQNRWNFFDLRKIALLNLFRLWIHTYINTRNGSCFLLYPTKVQPYRDTAFYQSYGERDRKRKWFGWPGKSCLWKINLTQKWTLTHTRKGNINENWKIIECYKVMVWS